MESKEIIGDLFPQLPHVKPKRIRNYIAADASTSRFQGNRRSVAGRCIGP